MQNPRSSLLMTEWFVVASILLLLFSFILTAKIQGFRFRSSPLAPSDQVEVTILGYVAKPGSYQVDKGTPLSEVVGRAKPKPFADLLRFSATERAEVNSHYVIDKLEEMSVFFEGACEPVELRVSPGVRLCDIMGLLQLYPNADLTPFRSRRRLKNKEIVKIPLKNVDTKKGL